MKKTCSLALSIFLLFINSSFAGAALVNINESGEVVVNVLADEEELELDIPKSESVEIKKAADSLVATDSKIAILRNDGKFTLDVTTSGASKSLDITDYKEDVVQIENRPQAEQIFIKIVDGHFRIQQKGAYALTDYEIGVDPKSAGLTLSTPSGERYLSILPKQALDTTLRSKLITRLASAMTINEIGGDLSYSINGEKVINLFNLYEYPVPVSVQVSAQTAEVVSVDQPGWMRVVSFLFSST